MILENAQASGSAYDRGPKPVTVKYGLNHVTALIEAKKASLVVIAHDVDPVEVRTCHLLPASRPAWPCPRAPS